MHCVRRADSRALCTAGRSRATNNAMIAITTNSSINVKPTRFVDFEAVDEWRMTNTPSLRKMPTYSNEKRGGD